MKLTNDNLINKLNANNVSTDILLTAMRGVLSVEDQVLLAEDSDLTIAVCLSGKDKCNLGAFFLIKEYKERILTCPGCNEKYKVRCFKNGSVRVSVCEK